MIDADGHVVTDNSNLNDFDVVDDSEEVFTENLPIPPTSQIVTPLQNSDTDNDVLLSDIDSEADNHLENTIVDDCCICYKPCNALNIVNTPCKHIYCTDCFYRWIRVRPTCPMCRRNFTSFSDMSNDEINNDIGNITQIYRRNIIENQTLIDENRKLTKIILKRNKKNSDLKIQSSDLMNRIIRAREQLEYTYGYNEGIKIKMQREMCDKLNLFASELSYFKDVSNIYKSIPYHKGLKSALLEYNTFYKSNEFMMKNIIKMMFLLDLHNTKKKKFKPFKRAHEDDLKDEKLLNYNYLYNILNFSIVSGCMIRCAIL